MYTNYARWFCKESTGHDRVWPRWGNGECSVCGQEFLLADRILVTDEYEIYHYDCYTGERPAFIHEVHT